MARPIAELKAARTEQFGQISKLREEFNTAGGKWKDGEQEKTWAKVNADYDLLMGEIKEANDADAVNSRFSAVEQMNAAPLNGRNIGYDDAGEGRVGSRRAPGNDGAALEVEHARELAMAGWFRVQLGKNPTKNQARAAKQLNFPIRSRQLNLALPGHKELNALRNAWIDHRDTNRGRRPFEYNASLTSTLGSTGRYTVAPETLIQQLEINMLTYGAVRQVAEQFVTAHGEPISWPTVDDTSNEGRELPEGNPADDNAGAGTSGDGGPNPSFGKTTWNAYKYTSDAILVGYELLEDSAFGLAAIIGAMLGERLGRITNRRFTTGHGAAQPEGIVTGATLGVTAASATVIAADEVIDLEHSVDASQRDGAGYMMHDLVLAHLRKLKDSQNRYIWMKDYNSGAPDLLNNRPYSINNHMATLSATNKVLLFGNFTKFKIRRVNAIRLYRLEERYREKDKDGFVAFVREDGGILNAGTAPIKVLQLHS